MLVSKDSGMFVYWRQHRELEDKHLARYVQLTGGGLCAASETPYNAKACAPCETVTVSWAVLAVPALTRVKMFSYEEGTVPPIAPAESYPYWTRGA